MCSCCCWEFCRTKFVHITTLFSYHYYQLFSPHPALQPVLTKIVQGKLASKYHTVFISGTRGERAKLKVMGKFGPIQHWRSDKVPTYFLEHLLAPMLCGVLCFLPLAFDCWCFPGRIGQGPCTCDKINIP